MPRRERWAIIGSILAALHDETAKGTVRLTRVAMRANIPYDRFQTYLDELVAGGLVTMDSPPCLTPKGEDFRRHYQRWTEILDSFGLGDA